MTAWRLLAAGAAAIALHAPAWALPSFDEVRAGHRPSDLMLLDRHGEPLQVVRVDANVRRGAWVGLHELSPALREAIVLGEDRQFWQHGGVDWTALAASAWANAWNTRTRGASTVTMQLAGLLDADLARPADGRSVGQKLEQIAVARQLESRWQKTQILEAYLNRVPLRGELVGVPAAAQQLFGKHPGGLDRQQAAVIAALVRGPNAGEAVVVRRACDLLVLQQQDCTGLATLVAQAFARRPGPASGPQLAPHFARQWLAAGGASLPRTTLDARLQRLAIATLRQQLSELRGREVEDGAVVVLDNRSGEVLAWVGSSGPGSDAGAVDAVLARRQPGSAVKPFVYAQALQQRLLTPQSLLHDAPLQLAAGAGAYQPQNFDHGWRGWVTAREALAQSLNVPAVRVGAMLGPDAMFDAFQRAGLRLRESAGHHGHALALGTAEVTLLDLTNAYRALARQGEWRAVRLPGAPETPRRAFDAAAAGAVTTMLADRSARAATFGFDSPLVTRRWAAVKTGTSKDMRDTWCVGFDAAVTVGVWVGNASGAPMHGVTGVSGAAPVWRRLIEALPAPPAPADIEPVAVALRAGSGQAFGIGPVTEGGVLALDPDIPAAAQQLVLRGPAGHWSMDGRAIGQGAQVVWSPTPGRHVVELRGADRQLVDRVAFEVRVGPPPRRAVAARR